MKKWITIGALAIFFAACTNGTSSKEANSNSAINSSNDTTISPVDNSDAPVDTNGHILTNGKVRTGSDKIINGDKKLARDSGK